MKLKKKLLNIWNTKASFGYLERAFLGGWFNPSWGLVQGDPSCFPWGGADWSSQLIEEPRSGKNKIDHIYSFFLHQILMIYRRRFAENLGHIEISGDVFGLHCFQKLLVPWVRLSLPVGEPGKKDILNHKRWQYHLKSTERQTTVYDKHEAQTKRFWGNPIKAKQGQIKKFYKNETELTLFHQN